MMSHAEAQPAELGTRHDEEEANLFLNKGKLTMPGLN
jgi:hypothetical protein